MWVLETVYCRCFVPLTVSTKTAELSVYVTYFKNMADLRRQIESEVFISRVRVELICA